MSQQINRNKIIIAIIIIVAILFGALTIYKYAVHDNKKDNIDLNENSDIEYDFDEVDPENPVYAVNVLKRLFSIAAIENGLTNDDPDKNIRYTGDNPNNYIYFNCKDKDSNGIEYGIEYYDYSDSCEIWRIVGLFDVSGNRIKIVREDSLYYNRIFDVDNNNWKIANLNEYLNGTMFGQYYSGLSDNAKAMISEVEWKVGSTTATHKDRIYKDEKKKKEKGIVGLLSISDYFFAGNDCISKLDDETEYVYSCNKSNNWLEKGINEWTITPMPANSSKVAVMNFDGKIYYNDSKEIYAVRPSVYLNANIKITGSGTIDDIFKLSV